MSILCVSLWVCTYTYTWVCITCVCAFFYARIFVCLCLCVCFCKGVLFLMVLSVCVWLTVVPVGCDSVTECADPSAGPASPHFSSIPLHSLHLQLCIYLTLHSTGQICLGCLSFLSFCCPQSVLLLLAIPPSQSNPSPSFLVAMGVLQFSLQRTAERAHSPHRTAVIG